MTLSIIQNNRFAHSRHANRDSWMFVTEVQDRIPLREPLAIDGQDYWQLVRVVGTRPWFVLRFQTLAPIVEEETLLISLDEDVATACARPGIVLTSLLCVFPSIDRAPLARAEVAMREVWRAEDRLSPFRESILFVDNDGLEYGGNPFTCREGLRRIQLISACDSQ